MAEEYLTPTERCPTCLHRGWAHPQEEPDGAVYPPDCIGQNCGCLRRQIPLRPAAEPGKLTARPAGLPSDGPCRV